MTECERCSDIHQAQRSGISSNQCNCYCHETPYTITFTDIITPDTSSGIDFTSNYVPTTDIPVGVKRNHKSKNCACCKKECQCPEH